VILSGEVVVSRPDSHWSSKKTGWRPCCTYCPVGESFPFNCMFPDEMKLAHVLTLLKKPALDPELLSNFHPISFLSFFF
jgi:hypothetical protein